MSSSLFLFIVVAVAYYALGHQLTQAQRKLVDIEEKLKSLSRLENLQDLQKSLQESSSDLQKSLHDLSRDLSGELRSVRDDLRNDIREDIKHQIELHEIRTR